MYNRLKELREKREITQAEISRLLGIHEYVYGQYEREYVIMPLKHINYLSNFYQVSINYILGFTNDTKYNITNETINKKTAGERLKEFRKNNKLTQVKLATILNTVQPVIANYEKGKNLIATPFLYTICSKYHVSADYLLGKVDNPQSIE